MSTTFTDRTPITTAWDQREDFLQEEDRFYLLQENSGKIVLSDISQTTWTDRTSI